MQILEMPAFTLKQGVAEADFLVAHEKFNREFMTKQDGYVSHQLVRDGNTWFDIAVWASKESQEKAFREIYESVAAAEYCSLIDQIGTDDEIPIFAIVKIY